MTDIIIKPGNDGVYAQVVTNAGIAQDLTDHFSFYVPNYKYMPKYRSGLWDGKIKLYSTYLDRIYAGLVPHIEQFAKDHDYSFKSMMDPIAPAGKEDIKKFADTLQLQSNNKDIVPRLHQYMGLFHAVNQQRVTLLSPTASGKSLIIYMIIRYLELVKNLNKILVVVPTTSLTHQMKGDFTDYSTKNKWDTEDSTHLIYQGKKKHTDKLITISTWQSIHRMSKEYFSQFDAVFVDECHGVKATSLTSILEKCNCKYRIGLTGTLDDAEAHQFVIEGLLGKAKRLISTKDLMDKGEIAKIQINCVLFQYDDIDRKIRRNYHDEIKFIINNTKRNNALATLTSTCNNNTLVLFQQLKHGEKLFDAIKQKNPDKKIFMVNGSIPVEDREIIRGIVEKRNDAIIVASYGVFSTGVNIKKIHNIIFASPTKSKIRVLQSIGRGLRTHQSKDKLILWDISDNLSWKKRINYSYLHFKSRISLYNKENFKFNLMKNNL